jgi:hypothetical protein
MKKKRKIVGKCGKKEENHNKSLFFSLLILSMSIIENEKNNERHNVI